MKIKKFNNTYYRVFFVMLTQCIAAINLNSQVSFQYGAIVRADPKVKYKFGFYRT